MTDPQSSQDDTHDQDSEPTMTAPPEDRPDAGASGGGGRSDSPDAVDADDAQAGRENA